MSRIGKQTIIIPQGVTVSADSGLIKVKGPKGELSRKYPVDINITVQDGQVKVDVENKEDKKSRSLWGTFAAHIVNMIEGVTKGFSKTLEINGVGYKVAMQGKDLKLDIGFSHPVIFKMPEEIKASVEKNIIKIESNDIELLGRITAEIRSTRKPEPYKGKGIKYIDEVIRRKAGKAAKAAA